jgi:hypothetical protein
MERPPWKVEQVWDPPPRPDCDSCKGRAWVWHGTSMQVPCHLCFPSAPGTIAADSRVGVAPLRGIRVSWGVSYVFTSHEPNSAEKMRDTLVNSGLLTHDIETSMWLGEQIGKLDRILP